MVERRKSRGDRRKENKNLETPEERRKPSPLEIKIQLDTKPPNLIVNLIGSITADNVYSIREAILPFQKSPSIQRVLINLKKVAYVDTSGISQLADIKKILAKNKKYLVLINPNEVFKNILDILNLKGVFDIREISLAKKEGSK